MTWIDARRKRVHGQLFTIVNDGLSFFGGSAGCIKSGTGPLGPGSNNQLGKPKSAIEGGADRAEVARTDLDFAELEKAWPGLLRAGRGGILAMIRVSG